MPRMSKVRKPTAAEFRRLNALVEDAPSPARRRRAHALVLYGAGMSARDIAAALNVHPNTIYTDLYAFQARGLAAVQGHSPCGAPARISAAATAEARRLAEVPPYELGLPYGRWSLATLRAYLVSHRVLPRISREHLRQLLKKGGCGSEAFSES